MAAELQFIGTRQLRDHLPLGLEFNCVQLAGQPAPGDKDAWNADALMEGVRAGNWDGVVSWQLLEDRVKAEEMQWAPLLQLHFPDQLDDYLNKVLVETGQRFFKKEPMEAPGYADLAARRRELLTQRLDSRQNIGEDRLQGQEGLERSEELQQRVRVAEEQLARTSASLKAIRLRPRRRRQSFCEEELRLAWKRRDLAATFRWSRLLGGRRWGVKKRDYRALSAALPSRKAWQDEWTNPGAEGGMGSDGSRQLVGVEGSDPRPHGEVGAQGRGGWRGKEGSGGAREQFPHGQEETSLPRRITSCRDLDDAPSRLSEIVARKSGHWLPEEEN